MGIGDDCAVLRLKPGYELLVTTDLCIENVHFRRAWHPANSRGTPLPYSRTERHCGHGRRAAGLFPFFGLPEDLAKPGSMASCAVFSIWQKATSSSSPAATFPPPRRSRQTSLLPGRSPSGTAVLRSGARPGDRIYVTGSLGGSAATLKQLFAGKKLKPERSNPHFYPTPRLEVGSWLRNHRLATAMIDISDGLSVDLRHICEESGVAAILTSNKIPSAKTPTLSSRSMAEKIMNFFSQPLKAPKFPPGSPGSPLPKSVK